MAERPSTDNAEYLTQVRSLHTELGIPADYAQRGLPFHTEAPVIELGDFDPHGHKMLMSPETAKSWKAMKAAAQKDGIPLLLESAYRSLDFQAEMIRTQLKKGETLESALTWIAAPGYSEHHTGRALDIGSEDCFPIPVSDEFERTKAFQWLTAHAGAYGFTMSYPRGNPYGIVFEPWHWCYHP